MQKGKGKAAAAAASQPQLASQAMDTEEEGAPLERDIAVTSQLLESFNAHAAVWEALEVPLASLYS